jgi:hypothetical protein
VDSPLHGRHIAFRHFLADRFEKLAFLLGGVAAPFRKSHSLAASVHIRHHEGATWLYHGHTVRFEWQSLQDRSRNDAIAGSTEKFAAMS